MATATLLSAHGNYRSHTCSRVLGDDERARSVKRRCYTSAGGADSAGGAGGTTWYPLGDVARRSAKSTSDA